MGIKYLFLIGLMVSLTLAQSEDYLGCWKDDPARVLKGSANKNVIGLTLEWCKNFCAKANTHFAGVEFGRQCFCGDSYQRLGPLDKSSCNVPCNGDSSQICGGKFALNVYNISSLVPCKYKNPCGFGAVCRNVDAKPVCECPSGKTGDPYEVCVGLPMSCGCWGDPHCHTFDKNNFDFMGRCVYDMITTSCYNKTLPKYLIPFNVRVKNEKREGVPNADMVSFIKYIEVNVYKTTYRLSTTSAVQLITAGSEKLYINNIERNPPYYDSKNGINVYLSAGYLIFSSKFGLTITWGGKSKAEILLSSSYANQVCGLCGDGDGNSRNDFVDRNNEPVSLLYGTRFTKYYNWGSSWRIPAKDYPLSDNSLDINNSTCASISAVCKNPPCIPSPTCKDESFYEYDNNWCAIMRNTTGPWAECIKNIDPAQLEGLVSGCTFDMCALEGNETQKAFRCIAYEIYTSQCYDMFNSKNIFAIIDWRNVTGCPKKCGENEVYDVRSQCPRSCLFPQGNPDCGVLDPIEGCFCQTGYVLDSTSRCVPESKCGCTLPDNSTTLQVGEKLVSLDCKFVYSCDGPLQPTSVSTILPCSENGFCIVDNNIPKCQCKEGYSGDGYSCNIIPPPEIPCTSTKCGEGALCNVIRGVATCVCPPGTTGDANKKCIPVPLSCGCWGDPHCHTFDKNNFDFMGRCIYDMVTTSCNDKTLSSFLTPFSVRIKNEKRENVPNEEMVSFIKYIEISVFGNKYRLTSVSPTELITKGTERIFINNVLRKAPYSDKSNSISIYSSGGNIIFSSKFGLTITWGGKSKAEILLSASYANQVCGLCGDGDGISKNDFVDRNGSSVVLVGDRFTKYFNWGSKWRIPSEDYPPNDKSLDINKYKCVEPVVPCTEPNAPGCPISPVCYDVSLYETSNEWCGLMKDKTGPWAECIALMDESLLEGAVLGCTFDMCALEGDNITQQTFRCTAYETLTTQCYDIFNTYNRYYKINWRDFTGCPKQCGENEVYDVRAQCPRSCLFPQGNPDCGVLDPIEGCYCKSGFVLNNNDECIPETDCGCVLPDQSATLLVGEKIVSLDCLAYYECKGQGELIALDITPCSTNGTCLIVNNSATCECNEGYYGDGYVCSPEKIIFIVPDNPDRAQIIVATTTTPEPTTTTTTLEPTTTTTTLEPTTPFKYCDGSAKFCTIYGDPHYISTEGFRFNLNDNCSYLIATDECDSNLPRTYEVYSSHQYKNNKTDVSYFKSISMRVKGHNIAIDDDVYYNGEKVTLPFGTEDQEVSIVQDGVFTEVRTAGFLLKYYPGEYLKFYPCSMATKPFCGLCSLKDNSRVFEYLNSEISCLLPKFN